MKKGLGRRMSAVASGSGSKYRFKAAPSALSAAVMAALLAGCGGGGGTTAGDSTDDPAATTVVAVESRDLTYTSSPDGVAAKPSISFYGDDDGGLGIRITGLDVDGDGSIGKPLVTNVRLDDGDTLVAGATVTLECTSVETGDSGTGDVFDIGISLDTTASMGGAAGVLAARTAAFATALETQGLDVAFVGVTVGDAYGTKKTTSSSFDDTVSTGTMGLPPGFDSIERPDTGVNLVNAAAMEEFFSKVYDVYPYGSGGGDGSENYLGAVSFLNEKINWRDGAGRILISIGDNCAHTPTSYFYYDWAEWLPPEPEAFRDELVRGGVAVNVVGADYLWCSGYYDMKELALATGGGFTAIEGCSSESTCNADLMELPLVEAITTKRATESCAIGGATGEKTIRMDVEIEGYKWGVAAVLDISPL